MKMQSYKDVLDEVMPIFHKNPDRFMRFYHAVNSILAAIPEGDSIRIDEHCKPASRDLFIKIATMYMMEEMIRKNSLAYIIHSGFISGYQNRYGDNLKPPTNVYHRMTA